MVEKLLFAFSKEKREPIGAKRRSNLSRGQLEKESKLDSR